MIKNRNLKKFLVDKVFPILAPINDILPKNNKAILIYCANDELNDNSEALYKYLIEHEYYKKYCIYCSLKNYKKYKSPCGERVKFISPLKGAMRYLTSKYMFYSMGKIPIKPAKKQMVIQMGHGIPIKQKVKAGNDFFFTYICASSEFYRPIKAKMYDCTEKDVCICGEPKTDKLFLPKIEQNYKLIVWAPTFRQSDYLKQEDSSETSFLPLLDNLEWNKFNEILREKNIKIVAKLHPLQSLNGFTEAVFSNLEIYSDQQFRRHNFELYELLSQSDAVLADYSSVYLEYLVLDRPIGFTLSDMEEYQATRGFAFENPLDYMPGEKLHCKDELIGFLDDIANGIDKYKLEREKLCDLVHQYKDGKNCERILQIAGIKK